MDIGIQIFLTDRSLAVDALARAVEERGFSALSLPEHTHMPVASAPPPGADAIPDFYRRTLDPFVALSFAAAVTQSLEIATGICQVVQRDPITLAKEVATLDRVSRGRFVFGVGLGWNVPELLDHGVRPGQRRAVSRERLQAMRTLWEHDIASFEGNHVQFGPSWSWPKPVQRPHPPVLIGGGASPSTLRAVVESGDGWLPVAGDDEFLDGMAELARLADEHGRDAILPVVVVGAEGDRQRLERYDAAGVRRALLRMPSEPPDATLRALDAAAPLAGRWPHEPLASRN